MGEHTEAFTVDGYWGDIKEICLKHIRGFGYKLVSEQGKLLHFEKGNLRRNVFTFSFEEAYKQVFIAVVGEEDAPVTSVSVSFSLPFLTLRKGDVTYIRSFVRALKEYIIVTLGYGHGPQRPRRQL
ncbi:MAG: hypothetical protein JRM80_06685 [Nitrososphaerota archaeon]|nr:hypothetical protein [Nitrososphaerota archaeon]